MYQEPVTSVRELCIAYSYGLIDYNEALELQGRLVRARLAGDIPDTIIFLQHPPVLTMGASGGEESILVSRDVLNSEGVTVVSTDRGGAITVHEPGQLVGYPVFNLTSKGRDLHQYVRNLEEVIIRTLRDYSIVPHRDPDHPGVWVGEEKVCAIGIRVSRWITKHGFALNVNNGLRYFSYVHSCGIADKGITSMSRLLGHEVEIEGVMSRIIEHCSQVFDLDIRLESPEVCVG